MPNAIKESGERGVALQVTRPARTAGLVEEDADADPTRLADVRVFAFDRHLLVVDRDRLSSAAVADLVATAARDTDSVYRATDASVQVAGNGYQVQLPSPADAGFGVGDAAPCRPGPGVLVVSRTDGSRLAADLLSLRASQLD